MTYRIALIERAQKNQQLPDEPEVLDYLQFRNHQCLDAWRQRRAAYVQNAALQGRRAPVHNPSAA